MSAVARGIEGVSERSLAALAQSLPNVVVAVGSDALRRDDVRWPETLHADDVGVLKRALVAGHAPFDLMARFQEEDGTFREHRVHAAPLSNGRGDVLCWIATKREHARDRMSDLLRTVCDVTDDAVFAKDADGRFLYVNPACARLLGARAQTIVGTTDARWFGSDAGARLREVDRRIMEGRTALHFEEELSLPSGEPAVFATTKAPLVGADGEVTGVIGILRDVTEQRADEAARRAERDLHTTMARVVPGALCSYRVWPDGSVAIPYATPSIADLFGATPEELRDEPGTVRERTHPDDRARVEEMLAASARDLTPFRIDYRLAHPTRGELWVEVISAPLREPDGAVRWNGFVLDITERKRVERELREQRDRLEGIAASSPGAIHTFRRAPNGDCSFTYASPAIEQIYGASRDEILADIGLVFSRIHVDDRARVEEEIAASCKNLTAWRCEYRVVHPTRGTIWVEGHSQPTRDADGGTSWHGVLLDVSEPKRAEAEMRAERERFTALAETVPGAICSFRMDPDGTFSCPYVSASIASIIGIGASEIQSDPARALLRIHPDDLASILEATRDEDAPWRRELRITHPDKGEVWVEGHARRSIGTDGARIWHALLVDTTERHRSEAKLRSSESRLRSIVETVPDVILSVTPDFRIAFINRVQPHHDVEAVIGTDALQYMHPASRPSAMRAIRDVIRHGRIEEYEAEVHLHPDDGSSWFHTRVGPVYDEKGNVVAATLIASDITRRKAAELAMRDSEERYRRLVELLPDAVYVKTGGRITYCNAAFVRLMGAESADQILGKTPFDFYHPDDHARVRHRIAVMLERNEPVPPMEQSLVALDGTRRFVSVGAAPVEQNGERAILVVLHDLTERQRTEHLLRSVLESVQDAILTIDENGRILSFNPATTKLFGHPPEALAGQDVKVLMPDDYAGRHDGFMAACLGRGGKTAAIVGRGREVMGRRADGTTFPIELSVSGFRLHGAQMFTGVIRDITERKRLEEQFRQAHKMEAFGQLAGGVAHDFNNLLTVILGETEFLTSTLAENDESLPSLAGIQDAAYRAAGLTSQLLAFSRKTVLEPKVLDVNGVVRETERMLRRLIGEDIVLTTTLAPKLLPVHVDPGQLGQVLMNLAVNARDAMATGGRLTIETANVVLDAEGCAVYGGKLEPGTYVRVSVRDTGCGMSRDVLDQVFQPFFTTKGAGRGTGLGLAVVHGIVTQSGGGVRVTSEVGEGTMFDIVLPVAKISRTTSSSEHTAVRPAASGTVLLVEDDLAIRRLAQRTLAAEGYRVLVACDGADALKLLEEERAIDILVTDVVMPKLDGRKLAEAIHRRRPDTKVLYVSGYTDDMLVRRGVLSEKVDFLAKPYKPQALVQAIRKTLEKS